MKKFFSSPKKGPTKHVYRHTWSRTEEEEVVIETASADGPTSRTDAQQPTRISPDKRKQPSLPQERRIFKAKVSRIGLSRNGSSDKLSDDGGRKQVRCSKTDKEYYTVVKNVKEARQCHESGETQEIMADIDYLLSSVLDSENNRVKCLGVINIATKCQSAQFRAHLRSRGACSKLFAALTDSPKYPSLAICTACVIYLLARDRLGIVIDQSTLELVIELVNLPLNDGCGPVQSDDPSKKRLQNDDEYENCRQRVWKILNEWRQQSEAAANALASGSSQPTSNSQTQSLEDTDPATPTTLMFDITLDNLSARFLAIEALTFICCRTRDDSFRKWMRESRGLHFIAQYLMKEADTVFAVDHKPDEHANETVESVKMLERFLRILEHTSLMNQQNQAYLVVWESSALLNTCARLFRHFKTLIDNSNITDISDEGNVKQLSIKSVTTLLVALLKTLLNLSHDNVLCCGKLGSQGRFIADCINFVTCTIPDRFQPANRFDLLVLSLGLLINLVEPCNANRRVIISCVAANGETALTSLAKLFLHHESAARETDGEMEKEIENSQGMQEGDGEPTAAAVQATVNAALKKASKHMEDSIVASHIALFLGLVLQQNEDVVDEIKTVMPDGKLEPFIAMLQKFLDFMRLTIETAMNSTDIDLMNDPKARIRAVVQEGSNLEFNESVPLKRYLRSAGQLYRMATVYMEEGNLENALKLYTRYITLLIENAPKHPEYKTVDKNERQKSQKQLPEAFKAAESLKKKLEIEYELEAHQRLQEIEERKKAPAYLDDIKGPAGEQKIIDGRNDFNDESNSSSAHFLPGDISFPSIDAISPSAPPEGQNESLPSYDRATKPKNHIAIGNSYLPSNKYGLRDVVVPGNLTTKFMALAESNTQMNIETCGILCGKLASNRFVVTHLLIPTQHGTSDSCTTDREEEVFDFQDKYDLITLGWIHTHPSQSAFLSSIDLHTHCSYQLMLAEAVAIVCAPRYNETGIFMLTPDFGLDQISSCRQTGFHPHEQDPPLFVVSPHAILSDAHSASVVDLRKS